MKPHPEFVLQFDPTEIDGLAKRYGAEQDNELFEAGRNIGSGNSVRDNLKVIVRWKSARRGALLGENTDEEIAAALQVAMAPNTTEAMAVAILTTLHGVGIPMASAILTAINPEKYTVLDYRALEALGVKDWTESVDFYIVYLNGCRELALRHGKTLRNLDRALWQWSREHGQKSSKCK